MVVHPDRAVWEIERIFSEWRREAQYRASEANYYGREPHEVQRELDSEGFDRIREILRSHGSRQV